MGFRLSLRGSQTRRRLIALLIPAHISIIKNFQVDHRVRTETAWSKYPLGYAYRSVACGYRLFCLRGRLGAQTVHKKTGRAIKFA